MGIKNRQITFLQYFENLQREYIVAELRGKIYLKEVDRIYYTTREMVGKRKTIEEISARNNFKNIFNSEQVKDQYYKEIYNEWGLPNFIYRDEEDRVQRRPLDIINYFRRNEEVSVLMTDGSIDKGKITFTDLELSTVTVEIEGKRLKFPYNKVIRMLYI